MKTFYLIRLAVSAAFLAVLAPVVSAAPTATSIVGTWTGIDDRGVTGSFVFAADGTADILKDGVSLKKDMPRDEASITYRFEPTAQPHAAIDLIMAIKDKAPVSLPGIVEFLTADKIRLRLSRGKPERPVDFSGPASEMILLERKSR